MTFELQAAEDAERDIIKLVATVHDGQLQHNIHSIYTYTTS